MLIDSWIVNPPSGCDSYHLMAPVTALALTFIILVWVRFSFGGTSGSDCIGADIHHFGDGCLVWCWVHSLWWYSSFLWQFICFGGVLSILMAIIYLVVDSFILVVH